MSDLECLFIYFIGSVTRFSVPSNEVCSAPATARRRRCMVW